MRIDRTPHWTGEKVELFVLESEQVSDAYVAWLNDPEVNRYLESRFAPQDRRSVEQFVEKQVGDPNALLLGIRSLALGRHVGNIKLAPIDRRHGLAEVGIMVGDRDAWGAGIGTDAIRCVMRIAAEDLGLRRLTAGCYASNIGSAKAFLRAGFREEGRRPEHFLLDGRPEDLVLLGCALRETH